SLIVCPESSLSAGSPYATGAGSGDVPTARPQQQRDGQAHGGEPEHGQSLPAYGKGQDGSSHSRRNPSQSPWLDVDPLRQFAPARIKSQGSDCSGPAHQGSASLGGIAG